MSQQPEQRPVRVYLAKPDMKPGQPVFKQEGSSSIMSPYEAAQFLAQQMATQHALPSSVQYPTPDQYPAVYGRGEMAATGYPPTASTDYPEPNEGYASAYAYETESDLASDLLSNNSNRSYDDNYDDRIPKARSHKTRAERRRNRNFVSGFVGYVALPSAIMVGIVAGGYSQSTSDPDFEHFSENAVIALNYLPGVSIGENND